MFIMNGPNQIELKTECIKNIPLNHYDDFTFIINGEEFKTNRLVSDILSTKVGRIHWNDPTFNSITINTREKGHFSYILRLVDFRSVSIPEEEIPFISEIVEQLENEWIKLTRYDETHEITIDNVFSLILNHEKFSLFYENFLSNEIEFIASHFYQIDSSKEDMMLNFLPETIERILVNENLQIKDESQLLNFINKLYLKDHKNSILYEHVIFSNADSESIEEFLKIFDMNDITSELWSLLSKRLSQKVSSEKVELSNRYSVMNLIKKGQSFPYKNDRKFNGVLNYLRNLSIGGISDEVTITASSVCEFCEPQNAVFYEDSTATFQSDVELSSWICFDFRKRKIIPKNYMIKSYFCNENMNHPKSWVIEGSNDGSHFVIIDNEVNCPYLNGHNLVHCFEIQNESNQSFRYIKMRLTGENWKGVVALRFDSFELFGTLI